MRILSLVLGILLLSTISMAATETIRPDADGTYTAWSASGCTRGDYTCIDEWPVDKSDYVFATSGSVKSTYGMSNLSGACMNPTNITNVTVYYYAKQNSSTAKAITPMVRSGGNDYYGTTFQTGALNAWYSQMWSTDPATGTTWTVGGVNNLEIGMKTAWLFGGGNVYTMYADVTCW